MKTGIFYGSSTGTTARIAKILANKLNVSEKDVHDVSKTLPSTVDDYDVLILGTPTYGNGELQPSWYDFVSALEVMNLKGKKIALFGLGDQRMSDTFCDGVGVLYDRLKTTGAEFIGAFNTFPYEFDKSKAVPVEGGGAIGLLLDEMNHREATERRINEWIETLSIK